LGKATLPDNNTPAQSSPLLDLESDAKLKVSVAHDDHNFPDMPETHRILVAESIVRSRLSLADLLNPAYGSESEYDPAADESSSDDDANTDRTQTHTSEGTPRDVMTVSDPNAMDIDHTNRSSMDLTTNVIADASNRECHRALYMIYLMARKPVSKRHDKPHFIA